MQVAGHAIGELDGGMGVGQDLFLRGDEPVPNFDGAEIDGGGSVGRKGGAVLGGGEILDLF
jgi:hypothetical protein